MSSSPSTLKSEPQQRRKPNQKHPRASPPSILWNGLIGSKDYVASVDRTDWALREGSISGLRSGKGGSNRSQTMEGNPWSFLNWTSPSIHTSRNLTAAAAVRLVLKFLGRGNLLSDQRSSGPKSQAKISVTFVSLFPLPAWPQRQMQWWEVCGRADKLKL